MARPDRHIKSFGLINTASYHFANSQIDLVRIKSMIPDSILCRILKTMLINIDLIQPTILDGSHLNQAVSRKVQTKKMSRKNLF